MVSRNFSGWPDARRSSLSRGGLWLDGNEPGRPDPAGFERAALRILFCRLSPYDDVAGSITHRLLLSVARSIPGVFADLAFFPPAPDAAAMRKDEVPLWLATGTKRPPSDFDVVAVSLSVLQEAVHLPAALLDSGLKTSFSARMENHAHPIVLLGGHGAGSAAFLHGDADGPGSGGLVDAVCHGDGVSWLLDFARMWMANRGHLAKTDFLSELARKLPGTYVPSLYRHEYRNDRLVAVAPMFPDLPMPVGIRRDPLDAWLDAYDGGFIPFSEEELEETLPLAAGCAYRCRFCQTGWMRGECSVASSDALPAAALRLKANLANSDLNLLSSDACSIPDLERILDALCPLFRHVSVKSLSVSSLVRRPEHFHLLDKLAKREFTFGVEGVSARLRAYLGKPATAADLFRIVERLSHSGLRRLKLFFIATGLEEERDVAELSALLARIRSGAPTCRTIASFMPLFRAPFTPLQHEPVQPLDPAIAESIENTVRRANAEFRWSAYPDEIALMNHLCRAGRAATPALVHFSVCRGMRYSKSFDPALVRDFLARLPQRSGEFEFSAVLPWSDLQASASAATLWNSLESARKELFETRTEPLRCGGGQPPRHVPEANVPAPGIETRISLLVRVPPERALHPDHVVARAAFTSVFSSWPDGVVAYRGSPRLDRPHGTAGLAIASADFLLQSMPPSGFSDGSAILDAAFGSPWFFVRWAAPLHGASILAALRRMGIKYQSLRRGNDLWHVVDRRQREKTGLAALRENADSFAAICRSSSTAVSDGRTRQGIPPGIVRAVLEKTDVRCPACGGDAFRPLANDDAENVPPCFDCLSLSPKPPQKK